VDPQFTLFPLPTPIEISSEPQQHASKVRLKQAVRNQVEFSITSLDDLIPADHKVRLVVEYVNKLDMTHILGTIQSVEHRAGRPAIDVKILLSLWLYATLEGIISARTIAEYCKEHIAFQR
jgi:transposase